MKNSALLSENGSLIVSDSVPRGGSGRCRLRSWWLLAPLVMVGVTTVGATTPAQAVSGYHTNSDSVRVRAGATTQSAQVNVIGRAGTAIDIACQTSGQTVSLDGFGTSAVWDKLNGYQGYISDLLVRETPYGTFDSRIPRCSNSSTRTRGRTEPSNSAYAGQCTWGAKEKFHQATGVYPALYGNAKDWAASARSAGWTVVVDAQAGAIVVFQPGVQGADRTYGHVAWVDSVETRGDGLYVHITEMNGASGPGKWNQRVIKDVAGMSYILAV
jgi:surface antigen